MPTTPQDLAHAAPRLKKGSLSLGDIVSATLANIAPAMSFFFSYGVITNNAGIAAPITILLAMIALLFLANTVGEFTKVLPSTGSFATFVGKTFGGGMGVATTLFVTFGYIVAMGSVTDIIGGWTSIIFAKYLNVNVPWQLFTLLFTAFVLYLMVRGAKLSTRWAAVFFYIELVILVIVGIGILIGNAGYITLKPFNPANLQGGFSGIGVGFFAAVYMFIGWENSAMMAEEAKNPRVSVPKALMSSVLAMGVLYMFLGYATIVGFHNDLTALGKSSVPFIDAAGTVVGLLVFLAYLSGLTSTFGAYIGGSNAQARIMFNAGREGLLPRFVGKVSAGQTPWVALTMFVGVALLTVFAFGWNTPPTSFFGLLATLGGIPITVVYLLTNLALPFYMYRHHRERANFFRHILLPVLGIAVLLFALWELLQPGQPSPFNMFPWYSLIALVIALIWGFIVAWRDPKLAERVGSVIADH